MDEGSQDQTTRNLGKIEEYLVPTPECAGKRWRDLPARHGAKHGESGMIHGDVGKPD